MTVAQIADGANVSVKTLFTYFDSKEDLVFGDENELRDALLAAVRERDLGQSALEAVRRFLQGLAESTDGQGLEGFHAAFGGVPQLHSRMLVMFERFEEALARQLAAETGADPSDPRARFAAAQLISLFRLLTSQEARRSVGDRPEGERKAALIEWINASADMAGRGLQEYAIHAA